MIAPQAQRWILACLRNQTFFSRDELNAAIADLLGKAGIQLDLTS